MIHLVFHLSVIIFSFSLLSPNKGFVSQILKPRLHCVSFLCQRALGQRNMKRLDPAYNVGQAASVEYEPLK